MLNVEKIQRRFTPHGEEIEAEIKKLRAGGMGKVKIGKTLGIGTSAVQRVLTAP